MTPTPIVILSRRVCDVPKDPTNGVLAFPMGSFGSTAFRSGRQGKRALRNDKERNDNKKSDKGKVKKFLFTHLPNIKLRGIIK
jgi:hypothetical protein